MWPLTLSMDSWVLSVSTARWKRGPVMGGPAGRAIFSMLAMTPFGRSASFATSLSVAVSVNRSEEHTSELQSQSNLVCRLLLEKKKKKKNNIINEKKKK